MKLLQQKRDLSSTTYYILLCFVLLCVFVIVPIILLIYSYNISNKSLITASIVLFFYSIFVLVVVGIFLFLVYNDIKKSSSDDFKKDIIRKVEGELDGIIKNRLEEDALRVIVSNALSSIVGDLKDYYYRMSKEKDTVHLEIMDINCKKLKLSFDNISKTLESSSDDGKYTLGNGFTITVEDNKIKDIDQKK